MDTEDVQYLATHWIEDIKKASKFHIVDGNNIRFNTPFTDPFDDEINLMITKTENGLYKITDQGYTIWNLETRGLTFKKGSVRYKNLELLLQRNHVKLENDNSIYLTVSKEHTPQGINLVLDTVMRINDFIYSLKSNNGHSSFAEKMTAFLNKYKNNFAYDQGFSLDGDSGFSFKIDYLFRQNVRKSVATNLYTNLDKSRAIQLIGMWLDSENYRKQNYSSDQNSLKMSIIIPSKNINNAEFIDNLKSRGIQSYTLDKPDEIIKDLGIAA